MDTEETLQLQDDISDIPPPDYDESTRPQDFHVVEINEPPNPPKNSVILHGKLVDIKKINGYPTVFIGKKIDDFDLVLPQMNFKYFCISFKGESESTLKSWKTTVKPGYKTEVQVKYKSVKKQIWNTYIYEYIPHFYIYFIKNDVPLNDMINKMITEYNSNPPNKLKQIIVLSPENKLVIYHNQGYPTIIINNEDDYVACLDKIKLHHFRIKVSQKLLRHISQHIEKFRYNSVQSYLIDDYYYIYYAKKTYDIKQTIYDEDTQNTTIQLKDNTVINLIMLDNIPTVYVYDKTEYEKCLRNIELDQFRIICNYDDFVYVDKPGYIHNGTNVSGEMHIYYEIKPKYVYYENKKVPKNILTNSKKLKEIDDPTLSYNDKKAIQKIIDHKKNIKKLWIGGSISTILLIAFLVLTSPLTLALVIGLVGLIVGIALVLIILAVLIVFIVALLLFVTFPLWCPVACVVVLCMCCWGAAMSSG